MDYQVAHSIESFGTYEFGLKILVGGVGRILGENERCEIRRLADEIQTIVMEATLRLDPKEAEAKATERTGLLGTFGNTLIFAEEIPNGYCSRFCCSQRPWYVVTTESGRVTIGWRKRVIQIAWDSSVGGDSKDLFPDEVVTKEGRMIHAYGYEKAKEYIRRLLRD